MFIYEIRNKINNKVYIGQSLQKTKHRLQEHVSKLRGNVHENPHLQKAWNKYGEQNFSISVLETTTSLDNLNKLEEKYSNQFKTLNREFGYNIRGTGNNRFLSRETKEKISRSKKGISVHTPESIAKIIKFQTGRKHSLESRQKRSQKLKGIQWSKAVIDSWVLGHRKGKQYPILISPNGKEHRVNNMTSFARKYKLVQQCLSRLINNQTKAYRGWTVKEDR